jgi:hypothetical protein
MPPYRVSLDPVSEREAYIEGGINLWRYKGRAALAVVAVVVALLIFAHVDAASDPGPTNQPAAHHLHTSGPTSNYPPPTFQP